ncbi:MAG: tetratricopeptide repeat protein [Saprospiraceae bacterium]
MKHTLIGLFLLVFFGQRTAAQNTDSLAVAVQRMPDDTAKIRAVYQLGTAESSRDLERSTAVFRQGYGLLGRLGSGDWQPYFEMAIGRNHANQSRPDSALHYFGLARQGFEKRGDQRGLASVFSKLRWVHNYLGDFEKASAMAFDALAIYEKLGDQPGIATALGNIGDILYSQGKYRESADYHQRAYDLNQKLGRPEHIAVAAQGLGDAWLRLGDYQKSLIFQEEALAIRRKLGDQMDISLSLNARGNTLKYLKRYPEALADYQECLKLARATKFVAMEQSAIGNTGHVYNLMGRYREALPYHLETRRAVLRDNKLDNAVENLSELAEAYAALGRFDSAFYFKSEERTLSDSLLNADNQRRMDELQTRFETAQKEAKIAGQAAQISRQQVVIWLVGGILALVLIGGALLFRLTRILRQRNAEKEFLIKEIHHRVKNNLQVLSSLLHLQSRHITDSAALGAVREGQSRVEAMGLIHQKLYMGENLAAVDMGDYLRELSDTLLDSFGLDDGRVKIEPRLDPLRLDVDTAIPLGLIINELATNSLKYAFPGERRGRVEIALWKDGQNRLCLRVSDDGVGKSGTEPGAKKGTGFGGNLVEMLAKKLKGKPEVEAGETGYSTTIRFEQFREV